jgi:tetratricopeptide (TPR) repeat protein
MDPELLKRIFVQREKLLEMIVNHLTASMTSGDKHHILLVGPRGSGKTHLVTLSVWELKQNPELDKTMRIAWLGEDDVFSGLIHFAFAIAKSLAVEYPDEFPADFKSSVRGLPNDDAALAVLNSVIDHLGDRHLLVVTENLDQTFAGLGEMGQKKLRAFLQETRRIATLSTTQQLFAGVSDRKEAFYGFFDTHHLPPLTVDDAHRLIRNIAVEQKKTDLIQFLNSNQARYRIRALHHLAGGNYRMYVLLSEFLTSETLDGLVEAFEALAEEMTPYFQERMRSLPEQQRQLVQCLCDATGAMTVKEIAEETFIAEGNCSKQLGQLKTKGYVRSEKRGKESYYDMAEPLMRLCLEVKNQRGRPLKLVSQFLKAWYPEDRLQSSLNMEEIGPRSAEYCRMALQSDDSYRTTINFELMCEICDNLQSRNYQKAISLADELTAADTILGNKFRDIAFLLQNNLPRLEQETALMKRAGASSKISDWNSSIDAITSYLNIPGLPVDRKASARLILACAYDLSGDSQAAIDEFEALIISRETPIPVAAKAQLNLGKHLDDIGDNLLAITHYTNVIERDGVPVDLKGEALLNRAASFDKQGDTLAAISDFSTLIETSTAPEHQKVTALANRGVALTKSGKSQSALADYNHLLELPESPVEYKAVALLNRGAIYSQLEETQAALIDFTTLIKMPDVSTEVKAKALANLGVIHWRNRNWQSSVSYFKASLNSPDVHAYTRTQSLFALPEPMIPIRSLSDVVEALTTAFENGDKTSEQYGGTPHDLISMILERGPSEWANYVAAIAPLYIHHDVAEKLGQGITSTIRNLDEGGFSSSQLEQWNQAWQAAGEGCEDLEIPLKCLDAAVEILKSDTPNDRPLFRLPLEIRQLIRPLLRKTLPED